MYTDNYNCFNIMKNSKMLIDLLLLGNDVGDLTLCLLPFFTIAMQILLFLCICVCFVLFFLNSTSCIGGWVDYCSRMASLPAKRK